MMKELFDGNSDFLWSLLAVFREALIWLSKSLCKHELFKWTEIQKSFLYFATEFFWKLDSCHLMFLLQEVLLLHEQHLNGAAKTFEGSCPRITSWTRDVINSWLQLFTVLSKLLWNTSWTFCTSFAEAMCWWTNALLFVSCFPVWICQHARELTVFHKTSICLSP